MHFFFPLVFLYGFFLLRAGPLFSLELPFLSRSRKSGLEPSWASAVTSTSPVASAVANRLLLMTINNSACTTMCEKL